MIQILSKLHGEVFGEKCESASDKLHVAQYTFTVADTSHIKCISLFIFAQFTHQHTVCSLACNEREGSGRKL